MKLENRMYPEWHDAVIRDEYPDTSTLEIANKLHRTTNSVRDAAQRMGIGKLRKGCRAKAIPPVDMTPDEQEAFDAAQEAAILAAHDTKDIVQKALAARPAVQVAMMGWKP